MPNPQNTGQVLARRAAKATWKPMSSSPRRFRRQPRLAAALGAAVINATIGGTPDRATLVEIMRRHGPNASSASRRSGWGTLDYWRVTQRLPIPFQAGCRRVLCSPSSIDRRGPS